MKPLRKIVLVTEFAWYREVLAIFKVNVQAPVKPIRSFVGLLEGVNVHDPDLDQVLRPGEFVEAISDKFFVTPTVIDDTFQNTGAKSAAATDVAVMPLNNPAIVTIPIREPALERTNGPYSHLRPRHDAGETDNLFQVVSSSRYSEKCDNCASISIYTLSVRFRDANGRTLPPFRYRCRGVDNRWTTTRWALCHEVSVRG